MLQDIVAQLLARGRKGLQTRILKVKSNVGTQGNKEVNKLVTAATDLCKCSQEYAIGQEGLQGLYWPVLTVEMMSNEDNDAAKKWLAGGLT